MYEATQTGIGKFYDTTGGWFFDMLTTTKDESGKEVSLDGTFDVVTTVVGVADTFTGVTDSLDALTKEDATLTERVDAMDALGQAFKDMGNSMDSLTPESKQMINDVVSSVAEMFVGEEMPEGVAEFLEDFDIEQIDFVAIGDAMQGMASYIGGMEDETAPELTQEDANKIVNGIAKNTFVLDLLEGEEGVPQLLPVEDEQKELFVNAIESSELDQEYKDKLMAFFGLGDSEE